MPNGKQNKTRSEQMERMQREIYIAIVGNADYTRTILSVEDISRAAFNRSREIVRAWVDLSEQEKSNAR